MNGISAQTGGGTRNKCNNKGGCEEANKFGSIIYYCFTCNSFEHKMYDYSHKDAVQLMFREKVMTTTPKEEDVVVNMILAVITYSEMLENVVFKEKQPLKNKSLVDWQEKEKLKHLFKKFIKDIQQKEPPRPPRDLPRASIQTSVKANITRNFGSNTKNQFTRPSGPIAFTDSTIFTNFYEFYQIYWIYQIYQIY